MKIIHLSGNRFEWEDYPTLRKECKKYGIVIGTNTVIGTNVSIGAGGSNITVGFGAVIGENVVIGSIVRIGSNTTISENVTIHSHIAIGENVVIGSSATIRSYTDVGSGAVVGQRVRVGLNTTIGSNVKVGANVKVAANVKVVANIEGTVEKVHHFDGLYEYPCNIIITSEETYIRLGCFTSTVERWRDNFWNNETEFPRDSEQGRQRLRAFNTMMFFLGLDELEDTQDEQSQATKRKCK